MLLTASQRRRGAMAAVRAAGCGQTPYCTYTNSPGEPVIYKLHVWGRQGGKAARYLREQEAMAGRRRLRGAMPAPQPGPQPPAPD